MSESDVKRKFATIRKISNIKPIEDASRIVLAIVDGWQTVVPINDFKIDDLAVFFEIDSFLPEESRYEFLKRSSYRSLWDGTKGYRVKTARFKKQLSQGILLPLSLFPEIIDPKAGDDVTELLHIKLWEAQLPTCLMGNAKAQFPYFIKKTDQERIQNFPRYFEDLKDVLFEVTEKLDGTSATYYYLDGTFGVCSRSLEWKEDEQIAYWRIAKMYHIKEALESIQDNLAIQGEIVGEKINGNSLKIKGGDFYVFDIYSIRLHRLLVPSERLEILQQLENKGFKLKHVPILEHITLKDLDMDKILKYAHGKSIVNPEVDREGVVFKSDTNIDETAPISFKVINNTFLEKMEANEQNNV
jgi:RNA ligase (TIGR02306 family)